MTTKEAVEDQKRMKIKVLWTEWCLPFGLSLGGLEYRWAFGIGPIYFVYMKEHHKQNPQYWWNNGVSQTRSPKSPGLEWKRGRLPKS